MSLVVTNGAALKKFNLPALAIWKAFSVVGVPPEIMGIGPAFAIPAVVRKVGLRLEDIDLFEINEAFSVQVLSFLDHFEIADDDPRVNPMGGAIAVGHPLASSGIRLMTNLVRDFEANPQARYGITTMCIGLGMGGTVIWERVEEEAK